MTKYVSVKRLGGKWLIAHWTVITVLFIQLCLLLYPNSNLQSIALACFPFVGLIGIVYVIALINANATKDKQESDKNLGTDDE